MSRAGTAMEVRFWGSLRLDEIIEDAQSGLLLLPEFGGSPAWDDGQVLGLFDSIARGYPIGSITTWSTPLDVAVRPGTSRPGPALPAPGLPAGPEYVLDGNRRLTALLSVLTPPPAGVQGSFRDIVADLSGSSGWKRGDPLLMEVTRRQDATGPQELLVPMRAALSTGNFMGWVQQALRSGLPAEAEWVLGAGQALGGQVSDILVPFATLAGGDIEAAQHLAAQLNGHPAPRQPPQLPATASRRPGQHGPARSGLPPRAQR